MGIIYLLLALVALAAIEGAIYGRYWPKGINADVSFSQDRAVEGDTVELCEVVEYTGLLPLPWVRVKFRVSRDLSFPNTPNSIVTDYYNREEVFSIKRMEKVTRRIPVVCARRGQHRIFNIDVVSSDLLLISKQTARMSGNAGITVYPRRTDIPEIINSVHQMIGEHVVRQSRIEDPFMFRGVREYVPGDPISHINWRAAARTDQLTVNQYDCTSELCVSIWLDIEEEPNWRDFGLSEESIRIAATLADRLIDDGVPVGICCNGMDCSGDGNILISHGSSPEHKDSCLTALARLDMEKPSVPMREFTSIIPNTVSDNELIVFISSETSDRLCSHVVEAAAGRDIFWIAIAHDDDDRPITGLDKIKNSCVWRVVCEK